MRRDELTDEVAQLAFEFFYWFSRFEFALKENGFLRSSKFGDSAEPNWEKFTEKFGPTYDFSAEGRELVHLAPKRQIVGRHELEWVPVNLQSCGTDMCKVVRLLKTLRNNLFHGGKHGDVDVDNLVRNRHLLVYGKAVLDQLAYHAEIAADYERRY